MEGQDEIQSSFDRSAAIVRKLLKYVEQTYVGPAVSLLAEASHDRPIFTTLFGTFFALSLLPVISFAGFSLFILASCVFISLAGGLVVAALVVALSAALLMSLLSFLFVVALSLTVGATGVYLFLRLAVLATNDGPLIGLSEWIQETKWSLLGVGQAVSIIELREQKGDDDGHSVSETLIADAMAAETPADEEGAKVEAPEPEAPGEVVVIVKDELD